MVRCEMSAMKTNAESLGLISGFVTSMKLRPRLLKGGLKISAFKRILFNYYINQRLINGFVLNHFLPDKTR